MLFINSVFGLLVLAFLSYVIWRNHRHEDKSKQTTEAVDNTAHIDESTRLLNVSPLTLARKRTLKIKSVALRLLGLTLFSFGFPLLWIPWIITRVIARLLVKGGLRLFFQGRNMLAIDAETLLNYDQRSLVLYLRAYRNAGADSSHSPIPFALFPALFATSDEERLSAVMNQLGPFVALGEIGMRDLGAARLYVRDGRWREKVTELMAKARLVVFRVDPNQEQWGLWSGRREQEFWGLGSGRQKKTQLEIFRPTDTPEGVWEEVEMARTIRPEQILFYLPFRGSNSRRMELYESVRIPIEKHLALKIPDKETLGQARFIGFKPDGSACVLESNSFSFFGIVNWSAKALSPVFKNLGAPKPKVTIDYFRIVEFIFGLIAAWPIILILYLVTSLIVKGS